MTVKSEGKSKSKEKPAAKGAAQMLTLKVHLWGDKRVWRRIAVAGATTLDKLSDGIFQAFDRDEMHLYTFFLTRKKIKDVRDAVKHPKYSDDEECGDFLAQATVIDSLNLKKGEIFYYLFDHGDEWWHEILVESVEPVSGRISTWEVLEKVGESPEQYPDEDEDEDEDFEDDDEEFEDEDDFEDDDEDEDFEDDLEELDSLDEKPIPMSIPFPSPAKKKANPSKTPPKSGGKGKR